MEKFNLAMSDQMSKIINRQFGFEDIQLKDIPNFGTSIHANQYNFRWPTTEDLEKLELDEPLKLKEIRTKGPQNNYMTAI